LFPFSDKDLRHTRLQIDEGMSSIELPAYFDTGLVREVEGAKGTEKHPVFVLVFSNITG